LAIEGYEAITIVAILAIIFLWGPQKLPEIARSIGQARREFERASKEVSTLRDVTSTTRPTNTQTPQDPILIAAKSLGISTEGKTKEELAKEIVDRTTKK
jgi:sec-independent protein translocase protein TatA